MQDQKDLKESWKQFLTEQPLANKLWQEIGAFICYDERLPFPAAAESEDGECFVFYFDVSHLHLETEIPSSGKPEEIEWFFLDKKAKEMDSGKLADEKDSDRVFEYFQKIMKGV